MYKYTKKIIFCVLILVMPYINLASKAMLEELEKDKINTTVVSYKRGNIYDLDEFKFVRECAEKYAKKHALLIEPTQCCIFGNRETARCKDSSGLFFCPPENAIKVAIKVEVESPFRNLDEKTQGWRIVYHGTRCDDAFSIAKNGFNPNLTLRGKGSYGPGIYLTPSWTLASALSLSWKDAETNDGKNINNKIKE